MKLLKLHKQLAYNKEGFHASHIVDSTLSIVEIHPDRIKGNSEDCFQMTISTKSSESKEERSAFISLDRKQIKQLKNTIEQWEKTNSK